MKQNEVIENTQMLEKIKNRINGVEGTGIYYDEPNWVICLFDTNGETVTYYNKYLNNAIEDVYNFVLKK